MAEKKVHLCEIQSINEIASGIFDMRLKAEDIAKDAVPGQFVNIKCADNTNTLLRRPISICDVYDGILRIIFEVKGEGTKELAKKKPGEILDIMAPLGKGFPLASDDKKCAVIGGGIGTFPLFYLTKNLKNANVYMGFRSADRVVMEDEFKNISKNVFIATDDGSYGYNGFAIQLLEKDIENIDVIYACGPKPMLKAVQNLAISKNIEAYLSLEQRMGCGIGACLVCACNVRGHYAHVCKAGPVFKASEVNLDD